MVRFLARHSGSKLAINGAEAARRFGFTTQVSSHTVFFTSGPSRKYHLGNHEVQLKRVAPRKLALAGRPAGEALSALWYLGSAEVTPQTFEQIEKRLPPEEFSALTEKKEIMPGWMRAALNEYESRRQVG